MIIINKGNFSFQTIFFTLAANVCGFASVAAADTDQNKTTTFFRKIKLKWPAYFPWKLDSKPKPSL
ncbi:hypothetical protein [Flavobacterium sp.]|jgi:hypothetical protein|uniref:hypothetical protein n=1 Tax=Flavobacterium sp. TaxID=239 RepID=UPI0037BF8B06